MKLLLLRIAFFSIILSSKMALAQTEPYYQLPQERTEKGVKTFPNIKPILTKFYFRAEGGTFFQGSDLSNSFNGLLTTENRLNVNWSLGLGYNYRDRWLIDIGYATFPLQLASTFKLRSFGVPISETLVLNSIPIRFQRSIWVVDRIARSTRLFVGGAIFLNTNGQAAEVSNSENAFLQPFSSTSPPDTIRLAEITTFASTPIMGEASIELRGKLTESIEIGVYSKLMTTFSRPYQTKVSYQVNSNSTNSAIQRITPLMFRLGITAHYNFGIITKYESTLK